MPQQFNDYPELAMTSNNNQFNNRSNSERILLLRAAFLQGDVAINSWQQWRNSIDIDDIEKESYQMLPLVYRNLSSQNVADPHMGRLKGVYRRTWCENQVIFQNLTKILHCFQNAEIDTLLLKDAALNLDYYQDYGLRMIHNFEILIHSTDALKAIRLLQEIGWKPQGTVPEKILPFTHVFGFVNGSGQFLNLRWHLFGEGFPESVEKDFWNNAKLTQVGGLSIYVLTPADQLFYVCVYRQLWNPVLPVIRLADAAMIVNSSETIIDWNYLITKAQDCHLVLPLKNALLELNQVLDLPLPLLVLEQVKNLPVSKFESREHQLIDCENKTILERFLMRYFQYSRAVNPADMKFKFLEFSRYLQYIWGLEHLWEVPLQAVSRSLKRLVREQNLVKVLRGKS